MLVTGENRQEGDWGWGRFCLHILLIAPAVSYVLSYITLIAWMTYLMSQQRGKSCGVAIGTPTFPLLAPFLLAWVPFVAVRRGLTRRLAVLGWLLVLLPFQLLLLAVALLLKG